MRILIKVPGAGLFAPASRRPPGRGLSSSYVVKIGLTDPSGALLLGRVAAPPSARGRELMESRFAHTSRSRLLDNFAVFRPLSWPPGAGSVKRKTVPAPVVEMSASSPPCARINSRAIARPSPQPQSRGGKRPEEFPLSLGRLFRAVIGGLEHNSPSSRAREARLPPLPSFSVSTARDNI
jgi:hypothetical protein